MTNRGHMFKQAEIAKMDRIRDESGNITKIINRVVITDDIYGNLFSEIICEGDELIKILKLSQEQHPQAFQSWITPKIQEIYIPWFEARERNKSDTLYPMDIEEKFGVTPIITSF